MTKNIDLTFMRQVKAKFSAAPGTIVFISAIGRGLDQLEPQVFLDAEFDVYHEIMMDHALNGKAYFVIDHLYENEYFFFYACPEFMWREGFETGIVDEFDLDPFQEVDINLEKVKAELTEMKIILSGNA